MSNEQEALARSLAAHFAPELGAALPPITECLLEGEDPHDTGMRSPDLSVLVGYAGYLVGFSVIALDVHRRLMLQGAGQAGESPRSILATLRTMLRNEAPRDDKIPEHLRERMVTRVADLTLGRPRLLPHETILAVQRAAGFLDRQTLLAGIDREFIHSLRTAPTHAQQLLADLDEMSSTGALIDGSVPLATWLDNAVVLAGSRREAQVFAEARAALKAP